MFDAIISGLVQGLTEFLPVSSSAHVILLQKILNSDVESKSFAGAIHLATAFAILIYFRKEIWEILKSFIKFKDKSENIETNRDLGIKIIISMIPVLIFGYFILKSEFIEKLSKSTNVIAFSLIIFGLLLYLSDKKSSESRIQKQNLSNLDALIIGAFQLIAAIFTGASRSGITLTTSFFRKIDREVAAKFIFLTALPVTALPGIYDIFIKKNIVLNSEFMLAFITAFISGLFAIYFLTKFIKKYSLKWFCFYRVILGVILLILPI